MKIFSRRAFVGGSAAFAAAPVRAAARLGDADIVVVGAGAAGIAAARRIAAAGRRVLVLEASDRIGGRCFTDMTTFGIPFDRGARWIHAPERNPVAKLGVQSGFEVYPAPPGERLRIGLRDAREGEMEDFLATLVRCNRAIEAAARGKTDVSCAQALPKDLGEWRATAEFVLGPYDCGKDLDEISVMDFSRSTERGADAFCRQGFGTLLTKLAAGVPLRLRTPVRRIDWGGRWIELQTLGAGDVRTRAVIVTVSMGVLAADKIRFDPELPRRYTEAIGKLQLGSYDHVAIEFDRNVLGLQSDDVVFEKATSERTAGLLANISGSRLCFVDVGGKMGRALGKQGEGAMIAFALDWLARLYGPEVKTAAKRTFATQWNKDPWSLGAFSAAAPGGQWARRALAEPLRERLYFAGEAVHETLWATVGGAWESGERAAIAALRYLARY